MFRGGARTQFSISAQLAAAAWLACALLQLALYLRASPYGGPFLLEWRKYFLYALYYELMGVWLVALPFLLFWLVKPGARHARAVHGVQAALLAFYIALSQLDHEVLRFLGIRLGASFLSTYLRPETVSDSLFFDVLAADAGGPYLSLALLVVLPLAAPANAWLKATGTFRLRKVEPVVLSLAVDAALGFGDLRAPRDFRRLAAAHQTRWLAESADKAWRFPDPARPYLRVPTGISQPPAAGPPWNVILIQLETLRGLDTGHLNPERNPSPTPFLDSLARSGQAAVFTRALSFGQPSINGLFAAHCSITPHSRRYVTRFTDAALLCLPPMLRERGYRAEMFNAGDTDWDGATWWLRRWYDQLWRFPDAKEHDRPVFRAAARRIRALGASGRPFLAALVSVSNHTPVTSREPRLDVAGRATPQQRILNTTHYTDDVLRELIETLRSEPWFERTIVIVYGDHGFNLGEHGGRAGALSLYRESLWVPLIIMGGPATLQRGFDARPASLLDLAPTVADLLGIRAANPWQGHSLVARTGAGGFRFRTRYAVLTEEGGQTLVGDPGSGAFHAYDRVSDWRQLRPQAVDEGSLSLAEVASDAARLNDHLLRRGLVWKATE